MSTINLKIEKLGAGGDGIAFHEGKPLFVAGALPGERIYVDITSKNRAELVRIEQRSDQRVEPICPHFGNCGGCQLQHMSAQLYKDFQINQLKEKLTRESVPLPSIKEPVITSPHSRRRTRLVARHMKSGILLGFNEKHSHKIIDVKDCALLCPELMELLPRIRNALSLWLPLHKTCDIQLTALPMGVDMVLIGGPRLDLESREALGQMAQVLSVTRLSWRASDHADIEPISYAGPLTLSFGKHTLSFPPDSFLQASEIGEKALTYFVHRYIKPDMRVLDLFCGLGTFGLSLEEYKYLMMVDIDGPSTEVLTKHLQCTTRADIERRNLFKEPFSTAECNEFDAIIFDPPRAGAEKQSEEIAASAVPLVLAISCNPQSFARDANILIQGGYELTVIQPVDQFLWSPHMELAACFIRR
jgi:23S rRNA (uracil1939-C5)-methyltransferase